MALVVVNLILQFERPSVGDPAAQVASYYTGNRDAILAGSFLLALGLVALLWFAGNLIEAMREVGESRLATTAFAGFIFTFSSGATAVLIRAGLAFGAARYTDPTGIAAINDVTQILDVLGSTFFATCAFAVAVATLRTGFLPRYWGWASGLMGLVAIAGGAALAESGFWSPTGAVGWIHDVVFLIYILCTSVLLFVRTTSTPRQPNTIEAA